MSKNNIEKSKIIFNEAKDMLRSSKLNCEQLDQKLSRFVTICITSITGLTAVLSFLKEGNFFFKVGLLILIAGFVHSLFKILQLQKTNKFASDGSEATTSIDDEQIAKRKEDYLLECLALTYEEKAKHNNEVVAKIAQCFDSVLENLEKYFFFSSFFLFIGFISL